MGKFIKISLVLIIFGVVGYVLYKKYFSNLFLTTSVVDDNQDPIITKPEQKPKYETINTDVFENQDFDESELFVFEIIYSELVQQYDVFSSYVIIPNELLEDGECDYVYGLSYVDYEEGYINDEGKTYFSAGFIGFPEEQVINEKQKNYGLEIYSIEEPYDFQYSYVYSYSIENIKCHCVKNNKYIKYEIVDGLLSYTEEEYFEGMQVDNDRGNIYNYDTGEFVYIVSEREYVPVSGVSIVGEEDYNRIIEEINGILLRQEANLVYSEIETYVKQSQDALISYLLGLQEEVFMGIPTSTLIEITKNISPMEHLQIGVDEDGQVTIEIIEITKIPSLWEKIATSIVCSVAVVGGIVVSCVGLPVIGGPIIGAAMEAMSQVVISNTPLTDINWTKVAIAAVAGAISGGVSSAISSIAVKGVGQLILREALDSLCDGLIGGIEVFTTSLIDGYTFEEACINFGYGFVAGVVISGTLKATIALAKTGISYIKNTAFKNISKIGNESVSKLSSNSGDDVFSELQEKRIGKAAKKGAYSALDNNTSLNPEQKELKKLIDKLPSSTNSNWELVDLNNNPITKSELLLDNGNGYIRLKETASESMKKAFVDMNGNPITQLKVINGVPKFEDVSLANLKCNFTSNRSVNFKKFDVELANDWSINPDKIPEVCKKYFLENGIDYADIIDKNISNMRQSIGLTWHESDDKVTALLVPQEIHNPSMGGISHVGGISKIRIEEINYAKLLLGVGGS